jgi:hypothetical protein
MEGMIRCECIGEANRERIKKNGATCLWILTIGQFLYFCAYSIFFTLMYNEQNKDPQDQFLSVQDWYRWIAILILLVGQIFFLFKSVAVKEKNPNELMSYLLIVTMMNIFFMYKLILDVIIIDRDYIGPQKEAEGKATFLTITTFVLSFIGMAAIVIIMVLVYLTIYPLREAIYEDIFWQIGGNVNRLEAHKARTQFVGTLEVDFIIMAEFITNFGFMCYNIQEESYNANLVIYWTIFAVVTVVAVINNIHGYYTLNTTEGTFNTKCFFIVRMLLQLFIIYISVVLIIGRDFAFSKLQIREGDELYTRLKVYSGIIVTFSTIIGVVLIAFARKLMDVKEKTQGEFIRAGYGAQVY